MTHLPVNSPLEIQRSLIWSGISPLFLITPHKSIDAQEIFIVHKMFGQHRAEEKG